MHKNNTPLLTIEHLSISYDQGKTQILNDINFSVHTGEILSIIGINGSGKSTLLKTIAGIIRPNSGTITRNYSRLAYVPQKIHLDRSMPMTVREFIRIYHEHVDEEKIQTYLARFQAHALSEKNITQLSGGELQKILIISALLQEPELLLLDEPTAGIDIIGEEIFYEIIQEVREFFPSLSIILVSHNIHLVYKYSNNVLCLHENNLCCHGTPLEVASNSVIRSVFGDYTVPYVHHPHDSHNHSATC